MLVNTRAARDNGDDDDECRGRLSELRECLAALSGALRDFISARLRELALSREKKAPSECSRETWVAVRKGGTLVQTQMITLPPVSDRQP